jgi:hypothetical protein
MEDFSYTPSYLDRLAPPRVYPRLVRPEYPLPVLPSPVYMLLRPG